MRNLLVAMSLLICFGIFGCYEDEESNSDSQYDEEDYVEAEAVSDLDSESDIPDIKSLKLAQSSCLLQTYFELVDDDMIITPNYHLDTGETSISFCAGVNEPPVVLHVRLYRERWWWTDVYIGYGELYITQGQVLTYTWNNLMSDQDYYFKIQQLWGDYSEGHYGASSQ